MPDKKQLLARDGNAIPAIGFGVWQSRGEELINAVRCALDSGYRLIDTAAIYGNESEVGTAIKTAGVRREDVFITTKLWNDRHDDVENAFSESLSKLGCDYIDLYLIHWPVSGQDLFVSAWNDMIRLRDSGRVKNIGVSNFSIEQIRRLEAETGVMPAVNQLQIHPLNQQRELVDWLRVQGVVTQAWSPLGHGSQHILTEPGILKIAARHHKTPAQIILRWLYENQIVALPKSSTPQRIKENIDIFDFSLSASELAAMRELDRGLNVGNDPTSFR
ncbi:2,5-diketo-D-gluconic acid reductase A [Serratia entomophila]|uniref:aldo/keto reductase n=1 Tax=Serratia entomophila TaxID=42906 RepID=UPI00217B4EEC|nr:aldo/keto reductase [Serratia entomophila]CAI1566722.1 2,5-diketo-D-gluconic acid reductase A [Serratia entomophila]CAI2922956.1 2,5-diketo-D-gluconic acid reductase A [Serratia entomophila]